MQQVNLFLATTRTRRNLLDARSAGIALLTIGAALLVMWGFALWQLHGMRSELALLREQRAAQEALTEAQNAQLDALSEEELEQLATRLTAENAAKAQALMVLRSESASTASFSARLAALAERHVDGVWLDHLTLGADRNAMSLSGGTLTPDLVPVYLQSLAGDPALSGGQIDNFVIDRPAEPDPRLAPHLRFRAATHEMPEPPDPAAES
jgi:hypothetical protein